MFGFFLDAEDSLPLEQLSPTKALRAAMLKSRFADTIIKAQQKTLLNHVSYLICSLALCGSC